MIEPKLLTEAEARKLRNLTRDEYVAELRERGLIAPEPEPEPLVEVALKAALERSNGFQSEYGKVAWSNGFRAGFERGMELRPPLTVEVVRGAVNKVWSDADEQMTVTGFADRLHAALTKRANK